jgi:uncharacterized membrane protein YgcG
VALGLGWFVISVAGQVVAARSSAEPPVTLGDGQVTDLAGVVHDPEAAEAALERLADDEGVQLFVVFVDSFGGTTSEDWAEETAVGNGLGLNDMLLAVAVEDRQYAYSVDADFPLSDDELADVATERIEPRLSDDDWDGAVIEAADGLADALGGGGSSDGGSGGGSSVWVWILVGLAVVGAAVIGILYVRRRRAAGAGPSAPFDPLDRMGIDELRTEAGSLLVELDDALKTSEIEVALAEREFGAGAAAPFRQALDEARASLDQGFAAYHSLSEPPPGLAPRDEAATRKVLADVVRSCRRADEALDTRSAEFDELRDDRERAPEVLDGLRRRLAGVGQHLPQAEATMSALRGRYPEAALRTVADNLRQAHDRMGFATEALSSADTALAAGDRNRTVLVARGAEQAIEQVGTLLDAVARADDDLRAATSALESGMAELRGDIAIAEAVVAAGGGANLAGPLAVARDTLATIEAERTAGTLDPVGALQRLSAAAVPLDALTDRIEQAQASLDQLIGATRSRIAAVEGYITTRRGAVGPDARTNVAEARRRLEAAEARRAGDPEGALADAQRAAGLAEAAVRQAGDDVDDFQRMRGGDSSLGSVVLGGILLDTILRSGRGGGYRGGLPGGFGGGGGRPGGFGGSGSRRGGHGRF